MLSEDTVASQKSPAHGVLRPKIPPPGGLSFFDQSRRLRQSAYYFQQYLAMQAKNRSNAPPPASGPPDPSGGPGSGPRPDPGQQGMPEASHQEHPANKSKKTV